MQNGTFPSALVKVIFLHLQVLPYRKIGRDPRQEHAGYDHQPEYGKV